MNLTNPEPLARLRACLDAIYDLPTADSAYAGIVARLGSAVVPPARPDFLSERSLMLITYGDTLRRAGEVPLRTLHTFLRERLADVLDSVHILPFYPWTSDDGFSVTDYHAIDPALGTWDDVQAISADFRLMFDAVINHMSAQSAWFAAFLRGDPGYERRFFVESPDVDLSGVTRPRTSPLLTPFTRPDGTTVHVWTTFSADQVDLDYRDPATLIAMVNVLLDYVAKGAQVIRLDAIAYMWKVAGTTCIHLPQTHALIRLLRAALDVVAPHVTLITETNVPHAENIAYFGDGTNEAQLVYNFTLPPLLMHSLRTGGAEKLATWINTLRTPTAQTAFLNFTASHDGIGVRPVEGILTADELAGLIRLTTERGGRVSYKRNPDGSDSPYELNLTYTDSAADPAQPLAVQVRQFLLTQAVMLALAGVPAVYIHSLLGSRNDIAGMESSGINRRINRAKLDVQAVIRELETPDSFRAQVFAGYSQMIRARRGSAAFHPASGQVASALNNGQVLRLDRTSPAGERVVCLFNLSAAAQTVGGVPGGACLITGQRFAPGEIALVPYVVHWIKADEPS